MLGMRGSAGEGQGREPPASENKGPAAAALPLPKFQEFQAPAGGGRVAGMAAGPLTPSSPSAHSALCPARPLWENRGSPAGCWGLGSGSLGGAEGSVLGEMVLGWGVQGGPGLGVTKHRHPKRSVA